MELVLRLPDDEVAAALLPAPELAVVDLVDLVRVARRHEQLDVGVGRDVDAVGVEELDLRELEPARVVLRVVDPRRRADDGELGGGDAGVRDAHGEAEPVHGEPAQDERHGALREAVGEEGVLALEACAPAPARR
ncbi:MAG: hypothetical protein VX747_10865 [Actinomycetota bacterium]|nr:hypothetical protein [Actinomycetota bacterium]